MPESSRDPAIPRCINGRYDVLRLLGQGGVGRVYLVEDRHRGRARLALKTLQPEVAGRAIASGFREEFAELAKLEHPNLARAYDFGRIEGTREYFFTTEFVDGQNAWEGTREASWDDIVELAIQALQALDFIHSHGILHNDLKPENLLLANVAPQEAEATASLVKLAPILSSGKRLKIIDFGLLSREHTAWRSVYGTPAFVSPERIRCTKADRRSDLYSLGIVLYTLFARRLPFYSRNVQELLRKHLEERPPPLSKYRADAPKEVEEFVGKLLEKAPEERFPSASEALRFLEARLASPHLAVFPAAPRTALSSGALLHREAEIGELRRLLEEARSGALSTLGAIVQGPRGMGKSRLAAELKPFVQTAGGVFVEVSGARIERGIEALEESWVAALRTAGHGRSERRQDAAEAKREGSDLARRLEREILELSERVPVAVVFDSFDRASKPLRRFALDLLLSADAAHKAGKKSRIFVLFLREEPRGPDDLAPFELPTIRLQPFSEEESRAFLRRVFGQPVPPEIEGPLVARGGGNPLFLLELARGLVERGAASFAGTGWKFAPGLNEEALPPSLGRALREKFRELGDREREILVSASLSKRPLSAAVLASCAGLPREELDADLQRLAERGLLLRHEGTDGKPEYSFAHPSARDALLERVAPERLAELHRRLAQALEAAYPRWEDYADELAEHWLESGNELGFLRFGPRAAEILEARGDFETAARYRRILIAHIPPTAIAAKVQSLGKLAEIHELLGDLSSCMRDLEGIEMAAGKLLSPLDRGLLYRRMACVEVARGDYDRALQLLEAARPLVVPSGSMYELAVASSTVLARWLSGAGPQSREEFGNLRNALSVTGLPSGAKERSLWLASRTQLAILSHHLGDLEDAVRLLSENLRVLNASSEAQAAAATACLLGRVLLERGRYADAATHLDDALRTAKEIGDRRTVAYARSALAEQCLRTGQLREAARLAAAGLEDATTFGHRVAAASLLCTLARIYLESDELEEARRTVRRAAEEVRSGADPLSAELVRAELARVLLERGEFPAAREAADTCGQAAQAFGFPLPAGLAALYRFVARWRDENVYDGEEIARAREIFQRHGYRWELAQLILAQAEAELERGHSDKALALLWELNQLTAEGKEPYVGAEVRFLLARWHEAQGRANEAKALRAEARKAALERKKKRLARRCEESVLALAR